MSYRDAPSVLISSKSGDKVIDKGQQHRHTGSAGPGERKASAGH